MNKENVLFGIIGLLVGLIVGFIATNAINRNSVGQVAPQVAATQTAANPAQSSQQPQISTQVVRDQTQTGGMLPQVQQTLDKAKNEPTNFDAQTAAAEMYSRIKNFEKAVEFYESANKLRPDDYETIVMIGNTYFDSGKFEQAEKWYTAALQKKPDDISVRTDLGATFVERASPDYERAIKEFRASLERNPRHEESLHNLAIALKRQGYTNELPEILSRLEQVNPQDSIIAKFRAEMPK